MSFKASFSDNDLSHPESELVSLLLSFMLSEMVVRPENPGPGSFPSSLSHPGTGINELENRCGPPIKSSSNTLAEIDIRILELCLKEAMKDAKELIRRSRPHTNFTIPKPILQETFCRNLRETTPRSWQTDLKGI